MKTKIIAPALVLAVALAATAVAANLFGSARTIPLPVQGDPIPGVGVSVEQSPGGIKIGQGTTNAKGIAEFKDVPAGRIVVRIVDPGTSTNYNSARSNTAGLMIGEKPAGTINFSKNKRGELSVDVPGPGPWTIKVTAKEGPAQKRN